MIFYISDQNNKLYATCKFNKETKVLTLEKSSFIKKTFNCTGCDEVNVLRDKLHQDDLLADHNEEVYLLKESLEFQDINSAACLVLGGKLTDAEKLICNEFGESIKDVYREVF